MPLVRVLAKGQLTLPKAVRDRLGIDVGDQVLIEVIDRREARLRVLPKRTTLREIGGLVRARRLLDEAALHRAVEEGRRGAGRNRAEGRTPPLTSIDS
jgi:AbrB family looped-hinge helix DNA binding protein